MLRCAVAKPRFANQRELDETGGESWIRHYTHGAPYNIPMAKNIYSKDVLLDIHSRTHVSIRKLLKHCAELTDKQLYKKHKGFGHPTVHSQLFHILVAEYYWVKVAQGIVDVNINPKDFPAVKDYQTYHRKNIKATAEYIKKTSVTELNTPQMLKTYRSRKKLVPAHLILRVTTHAFQHQGQILAMCRLMDHPSPPGMDITLKP